MLIFINKNDIKMGGCCRAQQLGIRWKKQLSLEIIEILKLFQNRVSIKRGKF